MAFAGLSRLWLLLDPGFGENFPAAHLSRLLSLGCENRQLWPINLSVIVVLNVIVIFNVIVNIIFNVALNPHLLLSQNQVDQETWQVQPINV